MAGGWETQSLSCSCAPLRVLSHAGSTTAVVLLTGIPHCIWLGGQGLAQIPYWLYYIDLLHTDYSIILKLKFAYILRTLE